MTDYASMSDDELKALYAARQQSAAPDYSKMSDDELKALYAQRQKPPQTSQGEAAWRGGAQGLTLNTSDEMQGLAAASPIPSSVLDVPLFGTRMLTGGARMVGEKLGLWGQPGLSSLVTDDKRGPAERAYDEKVKAERDRNKLTKEEKAAVKEQEAARKAARPKRS